MLARFGCLAVNDSPALNRKPLQLIDFCSAPLVPNDAVDQAENDLDVIAVDVDAALATNLRAVVLFNFVNARVVAERSCAQVVFTAAGHARLPRDDFGEPKEESVRPVATQVTERVEERHVSAADSRVGDFREEGHRRTEHSVQEYLVE